MTNWSKVSLGLSGGASRGGGGGRGGRGVGVADDELVEGQVGVGRRVLEGGGRSGGGRRLLAGRLVLDLVRTDEADGDGRVEDVPGRALDQRAVAVGDPRAQVVG